MNQRNLIELAQPYLERARTYLTLSQKDQPPQPLPDSAIFVTDVTGKTLFVEPRGSPSALELLAPTELRLLEANPDPAILQKLVQGLNRIDIRTFLYPTDTKRFDDGCCATVTDQRIEGAKPDDKVVGFQMGAGIHLPDTKKISHYRLSARGVYIPEATRPVAFTFAIRPENIEHPNNGRELIEVSGINTELLDSTAQTTLLQKLREKEVRLTGVIRTTGQNYSFWRRLGLQAQATIVDLGIPPLSLTLTNSTHGTDWKYQRPEVESV